MKELIKTKNEYHLFIGKVIELIGLEKTLELVVESKEDVKKLIKENDL